jgi:addiction module antitoxin, relB/dinJ family
VKGDDFMAQINFRIDDTIKAKAESVCSAMGLTMSTAINIFLTKLANEQRIPFEVAIDPFYSNENMARLRKSIADLNAGKGKVREVDYE